MVALLPTEGAHSVLNHKNSNIKKIIINALLDSKMTSDTCVMARTNKIRNIAMTGIFYTYKQLERE